jgi:chromosome segregation ATPase
MEDDENRDDDEDYKDEDSDNKDTKDEENIESEEQEDSTDYDDSEDWEEILENLPKVIEEKVNVIKESLKKTEKRFQGIDNYQEDFVTLDTIKESVEGLCTQYRHDIKTSQQTIEEKNSRISILQKRIESLQKVPETLEKKIKDLELENNSKKKQLNEVIQEYFGYEQEKYTELKQEPSKHGSDLKINDFTTLKTVISHNNKIRFNELADATGFNPKIVNDSLRSLKSLHFITKNNDGSYSSTSEGRQAVQSFCPKF